MYFQLIFLVNYGVFAQRIEVIDVYFMQTLVDVPSVGCDARLHFQSLPHFTLVR